MIKIKAFLLQIRSPFSNPWKMAEETFLDIWFHRNYGSILLIILIIYIYLMIYSVYSIYYIYTICYIYIYIIYTVLGRTKHVYVDIYALNFIHWALWRTLMRIEYFLFVHHTTSILAKLSTWWFEHSSDISCSLLVDPSHTDESGEGRNKKCVFIYIYI